MPKVSEAHRDARRRQVLEAAMRCFAREGFHRTTMQDIVREAGLSPGAIYGYFDAKDEIALAISRDRHARERETIESAMQEAEVRAALARLARTFAEAWSDPAERAQRRLGVQIWAEALRDPRILAVVREGIDGPRKAIASRLRSARRRGELDPGPDPSAVARVCIAIFHGLVLQAAWDPQLDPRQLLEAVDAALGGMAPPAGRRPAARRRR